MTASRTPPFYVLDSFALLALFQEEPGASRVREVLHRAEAGKMRLAMAVVNLGEVFYRTLRSRGYDRAMDVLAAIDDYVIEYFDVDRALAMEGAEIKGRYRMAYADCIAAALAQRLQATVITGDPEFRQVERLIDIEWLTASR